MTHIHVQFRKTNSGYGGRTTSCSLAQIQVFCICPSSRAWSPCWLMAAEGHAHLFQEPVACERRRRSGLWFSSHPPLQRGGSALYAQQGVSTQLMCWHSFLVISSALEHDPPFRRPSRTQLHCGCNLLHPGSSPGGTRHSTIEIA